MSRATRRATRRPRIVTLVATLATVVAVAATAAVGLGWPPAEASAKLPPEGTALLRATEQVAGDPDPNTVSEAKFGRVVARSLPSDVATLALAAPKQRIPVAKPAKPAPKPQAKPKPAKKAAKAKKARKVKPKTGWKRARVSWYGPGLYGNGMAGGGRLKRDSMVVAHRSLKFGTKIQFRYKGRTVIAVVKDRGPFIRGRVFDLGPGTAKKLRFDGVGTIKYRIVK